MRRRDPQGASWERGWSLMGHHTRGRGDLRLVRNVSKYLGITNTARLAVRHKSFICNAVTSGQACAERTARERARAARMGCSAGGAGAFLDGGAPLHSRAHETLSLVARPSGFASLSRRAGRARQGATPPRSEYPWGARNSWDYFQEQQRSHARPTRARTNQTARSRHSFLGRPRVRGGRPYSPRNRGLCYASGRRR